MPDVENNNTQLTNKQLKWGYWYVTHKEQLYKMMVTCIIMFNVVVWGYSSYLWVKLYLIDYETHQQMMLNYNFDYIDWANYRVINAPKDFQLLSTFGVAAGKGKYDLVAKIRNPNQQWLALVEYQFSVSNPKVEPKIYKDFILPGDDKYLVDLNVESATSLLRPRFNILSLKWEKVVAAQEKISERLKLDVEETKFHSSRSLNLGGDVDVNRVSFTVDNNSPYNYWKAGYVILLYSGIRTVGVNYLVVDDMMSGQRRELDVTWFNKLPSVNRVEVKPDVNVFDSTNFKEFKGRVLPDVRDYGLFRRR